MKKSLLTIIASFIILSIDAQSVKHVFMPYDIRYDSKNSSAADSLTEENIVVINDYPVKVIPVPVTYKTEKHNELLYSAINKKNTDGTTGRSKLNINKYPTSNGFPDEEGYTMHVDGNSSDIMTVKGFLPADEFKGYYYKIEASKGAKKYTPGFCPNGVYYKHKNNNYFITTSFGSTYSKVLVFRIENDQLVYINQFGIPGRDMSIRIGKKITDLKADNLKSFSSTAGGAYFSILKNGTVIIPVNVKQGNLKGLMTIDLNRFLSKYPNEQKVDDKNDFVKIYGSKLDETKNTESEYINAAMPYDINKIWLTSSTAKVILLDLRYPSQALIYDMNSDTIPTIKESRDKLLDTLKKSFDTQFPGGKEHNGSYNFTFYDKNWNQIKNTPPNMGKYKKCVTTRFKNTASKCTWYNPQNPADVEKYQFIKEYILSKIYYGKIKFTKKSPYNTAFQDHVIQNSFSVDDEGSIYLVTNFMMCKFNYEKSSNSINLNWGTPYQTSFLDMPGHVKASSGTTPTVFGNYVAITDNAFPTMHLNVYNKTTGALCSERSVFEENHGACENSVVIASGIDSNGYAIHSLILGNSFGYLYAFDDVNYTHGGLEKYIFSEDSNRKEYEKLVPATKFNNVTKAAYTDIKTATPKMNINNGGIIYMYNKQNNIAATNQYKNWQLTAVDYKTGNEIYSVIPSVKKSDFNEKSFGFLSKAFSCGNKYYEQKVFDNIWGTFSQTPNGSFIVATLRGFIFMPNQEIK